MISGETSTKEFEAISAMRTVPAIVHNGLSLYESHAILVYLASVFPIEDHWYPRDPAQQALINVYLHWHHLNIRYGCGYYFYRKIVRPMFSTLPFNKDLEDDMLFMQKKSMQFVENKLKNGKFVAGTDQPSIADLSCYTELVHMLLMNFDYTPYPNILKWMSVIGHIPGVAAAHVHFNKHLPNSKL